MAIVSFVLPEGFSMVAEDNEERVFGQTSCSQTTNEFAERDIGVVDRIQVAIKVFSLRKRPGLRSGVRMMSSDGQVGQEKTFAARQRIDPRKDTPDSGRLIHTETGLVMT